MKTTYSITQAQRQLPRLVREAAKDTITITRHDEAVAYVIAQDRMEAIMETMEILANPDAMCALRSYEKGKTRFQSIDELDDEG